MPKGVLFDFEGTVARRADGKLENVLEQLRNLGYDIYRPELRAAHDYVLHIDVPKHGHDHAEAFVEAVLKHLGLKPKRTELMSLAPLFMEYYRFVLHEDAARTIPAIARTHKVAIVSGLPSFLVHPVLEPVKGSIAAVVTPKESKACAPNPKTFRAAAQALGLRPRDVAVVSADCDDGLAVPKALGFDTVHVRREGGAACPHAKTTIASLDELERVLKPSAAVKVEAAAPSP